MGKVAVSFTGGKDSVLALHLIAGYTHPSIPSLSSHSRILSDPLPTQKESLGGGSPELPAAATKAHDGASAIPDATTNAGSATAVTEVERLTAAEPPSAASGLNHSAPTDAAAARCSISLLVTFGPTGISSSNGQGFKAHPLHVIRSQAAVLQIPHLLCEIDPSCPLESYRKEIKQLHEQHGISILVTGDIVDPTGGFMRKAVQGTGVELATPLWQLPRWSVLRALHDIGIAAYVSCVNLSKYSHAEGGKQLQQGIVQAPAAAVAGQDRNQQPVQQQQQGQDGPQSAVRSTTYFDAGALLLGQKLTPQLVAGPLSQAEALFGADMCGENGEYHTLVFDAPLFMQPLHLNAEKAELCASGSYAFMNWDVNCAHFA